MCRDSDRYPYLFLSCYSRGQLILQLITLPSPALAPPFHGRLVSANGVLGGVLSKIYLERKMKGSSGFGHLDTNGSDLRACYGRWS
jgi:hypothetical protein